MSRKLIEKLTGSVKLNPEELADLGRPKNSPGPKSAGEVAPPPKSIFPAGSTLAKNADTEHADEIEEIHEDDLDFELPPEDQIETVEEIIEDDSIDEEQVDEYYEVIEEEDEPEEESATANEPERSVPDEYPTFDFHEEIEEEEEQEVIRNRANRIQEVEREEISTVRLAGVHELPIDIYELHHELIIRTLIPGITPDKLKVSITRSHVSISGDRPSPDGINEDAYYTREIPFGTFSRTISLPVEVDVEHAEAVEKYGLLIIRLPKVDIRKSQELKVRPA
jgi:HSP20 family protein